MTDEIHIAGIVVHARHDSIPAIRAHLAVLPRAIVHAVDEEGRMVVTLEADSAPHTLAAMDAIRGLPGVCNVILVYQHVEPATAMDEEIQ